MQIATPHYEIIDDTDVLRKLELIGRVCYKSEDKITGHSSEKFIFNLVNRKHEAMIEHHNFIFNVGSACYTALKYLAPKYINFSADNGYKVSGSIRAWKDLYKETKSTQALAILAYIANDYPVFFCDASIPDYSYGGIIGTNIMAYADNLTEKEKWVHECITIKFVTDRGISHEIVRHRPASFAQESTRYVNYGKKGMKFINPGMTGIPGFIWKLMCRGSEFAYNLLIKLGIKPEIARSVLLTCIKTEIVVTANLKEWDHIFSLRTPFTAHPQIRQLMIPLKELFDRKNVWGR